jgi:hypothetical protein
MSKVSLTRDIYRAVDDSRGLHSPKVAQVTKFAATPLTPLLFLCDLSLQQKSGLTAPPCVETAKVTIGSNTIKQTKPDCEKALAHHWDCAALGKRSPTLKEWLVLLQCGT